MLHLLNNKSKCYKTYTKEGELLSKNVLYDDYEAQQQHTDKITCLIP